MMFRNFQQRVQITNENLRLQRRALAAACAVLLIASITFGALYFTGSTYRHQVNMQIRQRMYSASAAAVDEVNRMGSIITTSASSRMGRVRQYIYYMEQLNAMTISLEGNGARLVPDDAFPTLYSDLETLEGLILQSTTPTLDARAVLLTHLQALQAYLNQL